MSPRNMQVLRGLFKLRATTDFQENDSIRQAIVILGFMTKLQEAVALGACGG